MMRDRDKRVRKAIVKKDDSEKKKELIEKGSILSANYSHHNRTREIIPLFREGLTDREIILKILEKFPNIKESSARVYLNSAKGSFKQEYILDKKFNIIQHIRRYDRDILTLSKYEPKTSSYSKYLFEKKQAYLDMVNLLQKKERVLGFHRKTNKIKIQNNVNINFKTSKMFDFSNLTWDEKLELYNFVNKTLVDKNEKLELTPNQNKLLRESNEVKDSIIKVDDNVEILEEDLNISKIVEKEDNSEIDKFMDHDEELPIVNNNIIDATHGSTKNAKSLEDIRNKLLTKLTKK